MKIRQLNKKSTIDSSKQFFCYYIEMMPRINRSNLVSNILRLALCLLVTNCAGSLKVISNPTDAQILLYKPGKEEPQPLGKTPFEASTGDLADAVNDGTIVIVVQKDGHFPKSFVIPNLMGGDLSIEANLSPSSTANYQQVNEIVAKLFQAERLLKEKRFDEALKTADEIKKINENVAAAYHIAASVYFLQNALEKSRFEWIRALELDPSSADAQKMLALIEKKMGVGVEKK